MSALPSPAPGPCGPGPGPVSLRRGGRGRDAGREGHGPGGRREIFSPRDTADPGDSSAPEIQGRRPALLRFPGSRSSRLASLHRLESGPLPGQGWF